LMPCTGCNATEGNEQFEDCDWRMGYIWFFLNHSKCGAPDLPTNTTGVQVPTCPTDLQLSMHTGGFNMSDPHQLVGSRLFLFLYSSGDPTVCPGKPVTIQWHTLSGPSAINFADIDLPVNTTAIYRPIGCMLVQPASITYTSIHTLMNTNVATTTTNNFTSNTIWNADEVYFWQDLCMPV
jgi:hypothetical protein